MRYEISDLLGSGSVSARLMIQRMGVPEGPKCELAVDFIGKSLERGVTCFCGIRMHKWIVGALCLKISLVASASKRASTKLERGAFGLVVGATNEVHLFLPASAEADAVFPKNALVLLAVANRLQDNDWVDQLLVEEFGPGENRNP